MPAIPNLKRIVGEYRDGLGELLGEELEAVMLYGSHARGEASESSDVDVLCVMREPFDYADVFDRTSALTAMISLKYDVVLSRTFVTRGELDDGRSPFMMNVRRDMTAV